MKKMKKMKKTLNRVLRRRRLPIIGMSVSLFLTCTLLSTAQNNSTGTAATTTDPVLRAMTDELDREIAQLKLSNLDSPYFIQYIVLDEEEYSASATFGALSSARPLRQRYIHAQVRVGDYSFDNSEFAAGGGGGGGQAAGSPGVLDQVPIEDDYAALRHRLWLATDSAYKSAVETIARKRAAVQNRTQQEAPLPDFSTEKPNVFIGEKRRLEFDRPRIENMLREWSKIFREFPSIQSSNVSFRARLNHRYIVNSEGTRTFQPELVLILSANGRTQAADGMQVTHSAPFYAREFSELPTQEAFAESIRQLARDLTALRTAPVLSSDYSGPALLVGPAAAEMFARVLAPNLSGQRGPMSGQGTGQNPVSALAERINRPVLPAYLSVVDDPSLKSLGGQRLIGYYQVDDQGIAPRRVSLVEGGLLTDFLMSRRPSKDRLTSNGHGRNGYPGRETPQASNLIITATEGKSYEELKKELLELAKAERLDHAIIIKGVNAGGQGPVGTPVMTYRVYVADGREELLRGASAGGLNVQGLRHIKAVGNDSHIAHRLIGTADVETPSSVVAPSVLVEEISLNKPAATQQKPSLLTHPFFGGN